MEKDRARKTKRSAQRPVILAEEEEEESAPPKKDAKLADEKSVSEKQSQLIFDFLRTSKAMDEHVRKKQEKDKKHPPLKMSIFYW